MLARAKQLPLLTIAVILFLLTVFVTPGLNSHLAAQVLPANCTASVRLEPNPAHGKVAPGRTYQVKLWAKLEDPNAFPLTSITSIGYDASKIELDPAKISHTDEAGNAVIAPKDYQLNSFLSGASGWAQTHPLEVGSGIFALPNSADSSQSTLNILASCLPRWEEAGDPSLVESDASFARCVEVPAAPGANPETGEVLLGSLPIKVKDGAVSGDNFSLTIQHDSRPQGCGDLEEMDSAIVDNMQSTLVQNTDDLESTVDVLGAVTQNASFTVHAELVVDYNLDACLDIADNLVYICNFEREAIDSNKTCGLTIGRSEVDFGGDQVVDIGDYLQMISTLEQHLLQCF